MLFIFRKLRRSFFLPGKVRTYLAYAVGEIVLIVVGILLAVQISESNQARKDREEEQRILQDLTEELQFYRFLHEYGSKYMGEVAAAAERLLFAISHPADKPSQEQIALDVNKGLHQKVGAFLCTVIVIHIER